MKSKLYLLLAAMGIVCLSPSAYGGSSTYYYRTQLIAEANDSAAGKVYASTSASAPGDADYGTRIESDIVESSKDGSSAPTISVTFNVWAKSNEGYTFKGWSETKTDTSGRAGSSWTVNNSRGNETKANAELVQKTIYAIFQPAPRATITFVANEGGAYTVNGGAPASNPTNIYLDVTLSLAAQPDAQHGVVGWYFDDGATRTYFSAGSAATHTVAESGTIGVEFCAADEVATVTTYEALTAALADSGIKKVSIPSGSAVVVPEGSSMTIPSGKALSAEGTLYVDGSATVQGLISGNVSECAKWIRQQGQSDGVPFNPYGTEKYWKTSVATKSGTISGATAHATVVNGLGQAFRIALPASSKLLVVTRDTSVAVNHITGISSVATSGNIVNATASGKMSVLLETGCVVNGGLTAKTGFAGVVDCAGINCSTASGCEVSGNNGAAAFLNCPSFTVSKCVNISHSYYNCQSIKISSYNASGSGCVEFYDCGPTVTISYSRAPSTTTYARFYSGTYDSMPRNSSCVIYGGRYKQDPGTEGAYLATGKSLQVKQEGGYYVVYEHIAVNVAQIDTGAEVLSFETLQDACDAVGSGQTVRLVQNYGESETVTVAAGKNFSFELAGYSLTNTAGRIINNGVVWIKDSATLDATAETSVIGWGIENNGVITNTYGTYKGDFTLNAGSKLVTHNGRFLNQLVLGSGVSDPTGVADLRGGCFSMALNAAGFLAQDYLQKNSWVGKFPYAFVEETTQSGCEKAWQVTALPPADLSLYAKSGAVRSLPRAEYANDADWCRRAELESMLKPYSGTLDCTVSFDRAVSQGTVTIYANAKTTINEALDRDMAANEVYRLLITKFLSYGSSYTLFGYDRFLTGNDFTQTAKVGTADVGGANTGTVIKYELEVCHTTDRHANPQTPSLFVKDFAVATCRYMLGGKKAAIDRDGSRLAYDSLAAAVAASQDGETILIGADTASDVTLAKAGTYTIDPYGFEHTGQVSIGDGFFQKAPATTSPSLAVAQDVPSADATTYVVGRKVAQVGETFYDSLNQAIAAAGDAVVTLLVATDEQIPLAENASFKLAVAPGVTFDENSIAPADGCMVQKTAGEGHTTYKAIKDVVETADGTKYATVAAAIANETGTEIVLTVKASVTETVSVPEGKKVTITVVDGAEPNLTVNPASGSFLVETKRGATTSYEAKRITEDLVETPAGVVAKKVEGGVTNDVADASAFVARLTGNAAAGRVDNAAVEALDKITVTLTDILVVESDVIEAATFDVTPTAKAGQELGGTLLKFRLPVDAAAVKPRAKIYHAGAFFGVLPVGSETVAGTACKFIEVESNAFSPYGYELLGGAENPVAAIGGMGYATLDEALAAANDGDMIELLADVSGVTGTYAISKSITLDGNGFTIAAAANTEPRDVVNAYMGARVMFQVGAANATFRNLVVDGHATHYYTFLAETQNGVFTVEDTQWLHGGEASVGGETGVGYGAAIHVNGATLLVNGPFHADTGGKAAGIFPFTGILYDGGGLHFDDAVEATIGADLLLVGMDEAVDLSTVDALLEAMNTPAGFAPYTLTLGGDSSLAFTGASPLAWNDIVDYGKAIMDVSAGLGYEGLDKDTTPVEVGLLADTVLPATFTFADANFTVNGNGNALSGTIEYADGAGALGNVVMGTAERPLVLDVTGVSDPVRLGGDVALANLVIQMTAEQARAGAPVVSWDAVGGAPANGAAARVQIVDGEGAPTGATAQLLWDEECGVAYIGPCEARLTGPTRETPVYTTLADAIAAAVDGDTVTLMTDLADYTGTTLITKSITLDGSGFTIAAAANANPRDMAAAFTGGTSMIKVASGEASIRNLTLDGDATHAYTYLIEVVNGGTELTTENVRLEHGGERTAGGQAGAGYGAGVHVNNASLVVKDGFFACTGGKEHGIFPFTGILPEGDSAVSFDLADDTDENPTVEIGDDLLLVGMIGAIPPDAAQDLLDDMRVPSRFIPYTLTLGDGTDYAFTGASPLAWNDIIDYGKAIMDVSAGLGYEGLDKDTTPVEVGLLADTVLPATFTFADTNFTVNGNGNALSGTIEYTDGAGAIENVVMGTAERPLVLDVTGVSDPVRLGGDVSLANLVIQMTAEQARAGAPVVSWDAVGGAPANGTAARVQIVDGEGAPTGATAQLLWDEETGIAYIGPCEARLTGPTHENPVYTTLADAIAAAVDGDTVTLMTDLAGYTGTTLITKSLTLDGANHAITAAANTNPRDMAAAFTGGTSMIKVASGEASIRNLTLDGDATHAYTYLIEVVNVGTKLTTENVHLEHGGERTAGGQAGAGYGAGIHVNNASLVVKDGFFACTGGKEHGIFPFTGILPEGDSAVSFDLAEDTDENPTVGIGGDLLLVGMIGAIPLDDAQDLLDDMRVPSRFIPYTLTLGDGADYAFTGASPLAWNDIIDYGKAIMDISAGLGYEGLDKDTTPVEVGLLADTVLPATFTFADTNFTVNGNGNALSGTIEYTDGAGAIENVVMGTAERPLVLDVTGVSDPVRLGGDVSLANLVIQMTAEQARAGAPVVSWDAVGGAPANGTAAQVQIVDGEGAPTGATAQLLWDEETGIAYIGPCEARLTGPTHGNPVYTTLADAIAAATDNDTVTLLADNLAAELAAGQSVTIDDNGHSGLSITTVEGYQVVYDAGTYTSVPNEPAAVVWVDDDYAAGSSGGHIWGYDAFATIQDGVAAVTANGTVNILSGTYAETVTTGKIVNYAGVEDGNGGGLPTVLGSISINVPAAPDAASRIENIHFKSDGAAACLTLKNIDGGVTVSNCTFNGDGKLKNAINLDSAPNGNNLVVEDSVFTNGLYLAINGAAREVAVRRTLISGAKSGINMQSGGVDLVVEDCDIAVSVQGADSSSYGVRFSSTDAGAGHDLTVTGSRIAVDPNGFEIDPARHRAIWIRSGASGALQVAENIIDGYVANESAGTLDASANYWGSATPDINSLIIGNVEVESLYVDTALTDLRYLAVYVDDDFTEETEGWGVTRFATIQDGVSAVAAGGTVNALAGIYSENVALNKPLTLAGPAVGEKPLLVGMITGTYTGGLATRIENIDFKVNAVDKNNLNLAGVANLTVTSCDFNADGRFMTSPQVVAVQLDNKKTCQDITFDACTFRDGYYVAIQGRADNLLIKDCLIDNCKSGVNIQHASGAGATVTNCEINVVAQGAVNDTYGVRFGSASGLAQNLNIVGCIFTVDQNELTPDAGTCFNAVIVREAASGTLAISQSSVLGGVVNLSATPLTAENNWFGSETGPTNAANFGGLGDVVAGTVDFSPWLGDGTDTQPGVIGFQSNPTPVHYLSAGLTFSTEPTGARLGEALGTQPVVTVTNEIGEIATRFSGNIVLAIGNNPGAPLTGRLIGTTNLVAVNGVATFTDVAIVRGKGDGYTLVASTEGLPAVTSSAFNIENSPPVAGAISLVAVAGQSLAFNAADYCQDIDGDTLTVNVPNPPAGLDVARVDGLLAYLGAPSDIGMTVTFDYTVSDGQLEAQGTVVIEVVDSIEDYLSKALAITHVAIEPGSAVCILRFLAVEGEVSYEVLQRPDLETGEWEVVADADWTCEPSADGFYGVMQAVVPISEAAPRMFYRIHATISAP